MPALLDNWFPWFGDMLELGGNILLLIVGLAAVLWTLILERMVFLWWQYPRKLSMAKAMWEARKEHHSWFAQKARNLLISRLRRQLDRNRLLLSTLIKICPLMGLLGTVLGMLDIFDALAVTGSNNARATAGGVSKATVSTMAGMVVAISGLMIINVINRRIDQSRNRLRQALTLD